MRMQRQWRDFSNREDEGLSNNPFGSQTEYRGPNKKMRLQAQKIRTKEDEEENEAIAQDKQDNVMGFIILGGFLVMIINNLMKYGHL